MKKTRKTSELIAGRLAAQQLIAPVFASANELVRYMGIIQAQDYAMSEWAVGMRLPGASTADIRGALDRGEIIRTHVLRPTWHLVSPEDIYWMTQLCAERILSVSRARYNDLGLNESIIKKSNRIIERALSKGEHRTRQYLVALLEAAGIPNEDNRAAHLFIRAELEGIICSGTSQGEKQTYALLANRVPQKRLLARDEALAVLAERYFTSHGPATLKDFAWWSGLSLTDAKAGTMEAASRLDTLDFYGHSYWFKAGNRTAGSISDHPTGARPVRTRSPALVRLLPAFDEYLIGYSDRSAMIDADRFKKVVMVNGLFRPAVLVNGKVAGVWKRTLRKDAVSLEIALFSKQPKWVHAAINKQAEKFREFLGKTAIASVIIGTHSSDAPR